MGSKTLGVLTLGTIPRPPVSQPFPLAPGLAPAGTGHLRAQGHRAPLTPTAPKGPGACSSRSQRLFRSPEQQAHSLCSHRAEAQGGQVTLHRLHSHVPGTGDGHNGGPDRCGPRPPVPKGAEAHSEPRPCDRAGPSSGQAGPPCRTMPGLGWQSAPCNCGFHDVGFEIGLTSVPSRVPPWVLWPDGRWGSCSGHKPGSRGIRVGTRQQDGVFFSPGYGCGDGAGGVRTASFRGVEGWAHSSHNEVPSVASLRHTPRPRGLIRLLKS